MRSIRLSLTVYFLGLLAVALGAASAIVYQSALKTLEEKKDADARLIDAQYKERCKAEEAKLDDLLQGQAQTLAGVAQVQFDWNRLRYRELNSLGLLAVAGAPDAYLLAPSWACQAKHGQFFFELNRKDLGEITFEDSEVLERASKADVLFQIDSVWGASYRSRSLGERLFPLDPKVFTAEGEAPWKFADDLDGDAPLRRVTFKTSAPIAPSPFPRRPRDDRPATADGSGPPRPADGRFGDRPPPPPPPRELQNRTAVFVQVAAPTRDRDQALAGHKGWRDAETARLAADADAALAELRNRLLLTACVVFLAAGLGCYGLVRLGLSPLQRVSEAVRRVSAKDFRLQVDQGRLPGELKPIVRRLSDTLEMLKRAFQREKQATADISHELRTPLAALLTTTEIALRKPRSAAEYEELLRDCRGSALQMTQAVERLLALARLDAGVAQVRPQAVDASALADQCAALVRPLAEARGVRLTVHHAGPAPLTADPDKLREIFTNLLHNAVEYNRPHGAIDLTVARENGSLQVEVKDTGVGIGPEARAHLFERFYRADPSRTGDGLHAGLGLAIVKGYVDLMGGAIAVESVEGEGSTFRVRLPAHQA